MKRQSIMAGVSWAVLLIFMATTKPSALPVLVLIVPFVLLFIASTVSWSLVERLYVTYLVKNRYKPRLKRFGVVLSAGLVLTLVLQSLGQLTIRDVITLTAILTIGYIYVARNRYDIEQR